jgi:hypothetical protein
LCCVVLWEAAPAAEWMQWLKRLISSNERAHPQSALA